MGDNVIEVPVDDVVEGGRYVWLRLDVEIVIWLQSDKLKGARRLVHNRRPRSAGSTGPMRAGRRQGSVRSIRMAGLGMAGLRIVDLGIADLRIADLGIEALGFAIRLQLRSGGSSVLW
jgi:hypothetical protein